MRFLDKYFKKFFSHPAVRWIVAHACLFIALSIVVSDSLFILNELGAIDYNVGQYLLGEQIFSTGYLILFPLGYYIYTRNFCDWSKDSFYLILIYSLSFSIHHYIIPFSLEAELVLNAILLYLTVMIVKNLIEEKINKKIDKKIRLK